MVLVLLVTTAMATSVQSAQSGTASDGAVMGAAAVLLMLLVLLLIVLVRQHVGAHGTCHEPTNGAQDTAAQLVSQECTASTTDQC